jgi:hypothetical protein
MNTRARIVCGSIIIAALPLAMPTIAQEKKTKAEKVAGDIGLLDTEKNYMIVVTKDGKLVTLDYTTKTKVTELKASQAKISDIGLGSKAAVEYVQKGEKKFLTKIEFTPAKGE